MRSFLFPDLNVWIALTYRAHKQHSAAKKWLDSLGPECDLCFCRLTQIGFLRLLTTPAIMGGQVLSQAGAWKIYDEWLEHGRSLFVEEPPALERTFRALSESGQSAPKDWADSYICAFAQLSGMRLVTFDQVLHRRCRGSVLLTP